MELIRDRNCVSTAHRLSAKGTTNWAAEILGYPLSDYNTAVKDCRDFISPLTLRWPDGSETVVFDSEIHGYHGELNWSAKYRGQGQPQNFTCPECGNQQFAVTMQFDYCNACQDLLDEEPEIAVQDYFCNIEFAGTCQKCGQQTTVLEMDL